MSEQPHSIFWPVLGALVVFFVVLPIALSVLFFGCAGCLAAGGA